MHTRKLRAFVRDWFCMHVLAYWLRHAEPEQLYDLGGEMVRTAWERENPNATGKISAEIAITQHLSEHPDVQDAGKWGPA